MNIAFSKIYQFVTIRSQPQIKTLTPFDNFEEIMTKIEYKDLVMIQMCQYRVVNISTHFKGTLVG